MRKIIGIATGGMAGAVLRYWIRSVDMSGMPLDTLAVNTVGCFLLAFILTMILERTKLPSDLQTGLTVGFLGAFTTFSSICQEYVMFFREGQGGLALVYSLLTVALGLLSVYTGWRLARRLRPSEATDMTDDEDQV